MKWYIGQRVVCIKTHSQGVVKKGNEYVIKGISTSPCTCGILVLDVGLKSERFTTAHRDCGTVWISDGIRWLRECLFAPLDELSDYTVETLLNEIEEPVKVKV